jgi:pyridinium-3,5-bisthiocarboxylic acid mononucleotide nickel chelatase
MKTLYLDCFAGISGDMTIGALIDLGLELPALEHELLKLKLDSYKLQSSRVDKRGIGATQFKVILTAGGSERLADSQFEEQHAHSHHAHDEEHAIMREPTHEHTQTERALKDILALIENSELSPPVKANASRIFTRLGEAEAAVHGIPLAEVHFHEVGGVDAIVDIVGAAIGVELLGVQQIVSSPLHLGSGFITMAHGLYPIPAPATARLIEGVPVYSTEATGELVTPTGAAIVTTLASSFGSIPLMKVHGIGYGAGTRDRQFPNVLRVFLGETEQVTPATNAQPQSVAATAAREPRAPHPEQHAAQPTAAGYHEGQALVIEANIDDMNPQLYESLLERLLAAGALDAILIPAFMKKQRPGTLLQVIAHPASVDELLGIIFSESTTIGVRTYEVQRKMLQREVCQVATQYGTVRVKVARLSDQVVNIAPEYEDCRMLARQACVPVKVVIAAAMQAMP